MVQQERSVYQRRRLIALLGLAAIIAVIALIIWRPLSSGGAAQSKPVTLAKDLEQQEKKTTEKIDKPKACVAAQLQITATSDKTSYGPDEQPQLGLTITNTGKAPCTIDLGTQHMLFTITSGSDQVWNSRDCQQDSTSNPVLLQAGQTLDSENIAWDRTRSSPESCDISREPVVAGGASYHLRVTIGEFAGVETKQFMLY